VASSSERLWMTLTVAAGTLVVTALVLSAPAVQRCAGAADGIWSCLRQQVIDYGLLPADEPGPLVTIADPSAPPAPASDATEPEIIAEPVETQSEPIPEPPLQTATAPETAVTPVPETALTISPSGDAPAADADMPAPQEPADDPALPPDTDPAPASAADPDAPPPSSADSPGATEPAAVPPLVPGVEPAPAPDGQQPQDLAGAPSQIEWAGPQPGQTPIAPGPTLAQPPLTPPASEPPMQVAAAPETAATPEPAPQLADTALPLAPPQTPDIVPPADTAGQGPVDPVLANPQPPQGGLEPAPVATPVLPAPAPAISAAAAATRSASDALRTGFEVAAPLLRLTAQPTSGIGVALLAGLSLMPPAAPPARPALTPLAEPDDPTLAPAEPEPVAQSAGRPATAPPPPSVADSPAPEARPTPAPAAPLAPAVDPLRPANAPLRPATIAPAENADAEPETRPGIAPAPAADAATEPAPSLSPARPAGPLPSPSPVSQPPAPATDPPPGPATDPPPGPMIVAHARLGTAPAGRVEIAPTIDAVEIDGAVNRIAGTGPEGARIDLFVGQRYIDSATVEGGRWLVEAQQVLNLSGQRLTVSLAGGIAARSGVDLDFKLAPPGVRLVGKEVADATLGPALQPDSELEPGSARLQPLAAVSPELLRFQSGKAIVRRGDTLWAIARRVYGRGILYRHIFEANREQIRRPGRIYPGQVFDLPATP